jgi:hypothetical protein
VHQLHIEHGIDVDNRLDKIEAQIKLREMILAARQQKRAKLAYALQHSTKRLGKQKYVSCMLSLCLSLCVCVCVCVRLFVRTRAYEIRGLVCHSLLTQVTM